MDQPREARACDARATGRRTWCALVTGVQTCALPTWNSLHQGQTISLLGESKMDPSMLPPLWAMVIGTHLWFAGSLLARARADNLWREAGKDWVHKLGEAPR